eukprot:g40401.t1
MTFRNLFALVFAKEKGMDDDGKFRDEYVDILGHVDIKEEEVLGVLKTIKIDSSLEPAEISPKILKEAMVEIAGALSEIFVSTLATM